MGNNSSSGALEIAADAVKFVRVGDPDPPPSEEDRTPPTINLRTIRRNFGRCEGSYSVLRATVYDRESGLAYVRASLGIPPSIDDPFGVYTLTLALSRPGECMSWRVLAIDRAGNRTDKQGTLCSPPRPPGCDPPDDNLSAASMQEHEIPLPPGVRAQPAVALLASGYAFEAEAFLAQVGEPVELVGEDFDPVATAARFPVLLIPSGGLYGLATPPSQGRAGGGSGDRGLVTLHADGVPVCSLVI